MRQYNIITAKIKPGIPIKIRLYSPAYDQSKIIPFTNEAGSFRPFIESIENWMKENEFKVIGYGLGKDESYHIITDTDKPLNRL